MTRAILQPQSQSSSLCKTMISTAVFPLLLLTATATAFARPKPPFKIVHLGDSYSSGNGARNSDGRRDYFSIPGCYRSPSNWGSRFAASLTEDFSVDYINRACSGGTLDDITNQRKLNSFYSVASFFGASCPGPEYPDEEVIVTNGIRCDRFLRPQIEAVDLNVDLVLLSVGGNDGGFGDIVVRCLTVLRNPAMCEDAINNANMVLDGFAPRLASTFEMIRARMKPEARIVLSTYPHLILDITYQIRFLFDVFDAGTAIRNLGSRADVVQRDAVNRANAAAGVDYVLLFDKTKTIFAGREANPSTAVRNPDRWILEFEGKVIEEWYHPNQSGHQRWGSAFSVPGTFGTVERTLKTGGNVDLVFVIDTTGPMGEVIEQVRVDLEVLFSELSATTTSFRVAVLAYRDHKGRNGFGDEFSAQVIQTFTNSLPSIHVAFDSLVSRSAIGGPKSVLSGMNEGEELTWRPGVTKTAVVLGDAPALVEDWTEPINSPPAQAVTHGITFDPIRILRVNCDGLTPPVVRSVANVGEGFVVNERANLTRTLLDVVDETAGLPFATFGIAIAGKVGEPVLFDAQGSFDPRGRPIDLYEWDFDGDGTFDVSTTEIQIENTYISKFSGFVILRVTCAGRTSLASARTVINEEGFVPQGDEAPCEDNEDGTPILLTDTGSLNNSCTPIDLPTSDAPGVSEITSGSEGLRESLDALNAAVSHPSPLFRFLVRRIRRAALAGRQSDSLRLLQLLRRRARARRFALSRRSACIRRGCLLQEQFRRVIAAIELVRAVLKF